MIELQNSSSQSFNKILVPIDYSECSVLAIRYAAIVALNSNATLYLYHVFYSPAYDLIGLTGNKETQEQLRIKVTEKLIVSEQKELNEFVNKVVQEEEPKKLGKENIEWYLEPGMPKDKIFEAVNRFQIDLVVMGTRGVDKKSASLLGSVTEIVLRKLKIPIITIPENVDLEKEKVIDRMVYLTDFDESDFFSISYLTHFIKLLKLEIHCVHIGSKSDNWDELKMNGLKQYFKNVYGVDTTICQILDKKGSIVEALDKYVIENNINLISLTTKKRKLYDKVFKPNLTLKLFYHTNIPLMIFHS